MWVKTTCCNRLYLPFNKKLIFTIFCNGAVLKQYTGFYLQKDTTFSNSPASLGRELQPPSSCTSWCISTKVLTYRRLQPSLFFQGPRFINFQTGSMNNINQVYLHQPISFVQTNTESTNHFSECCNQKIVTITRHQFWTHNIVAINRSI